jgi:hypothetical protein
MGTNAIGGFLILEGEANENVVAHSNILPDELVVFNAQHMI